jgi:parallel beta-helix repeat protein
MKNVCLLRRFLFGCAAAALVLAAGCGGGSSSSGPSSSLTVTNPGTGSTPVILLSSGSTNLSPGATLTITATVSNTSNTAVIWSVQGVTGGNSTVGTIAAGSGDQATYTAPATPGTYAVKATSQADSAVSKSLQITVVSGATSPVQVGLDPATATLQPSQTLNLQASVSGSGTTTVTWSVDNVVGGSPSVGTIAAGTDGQATYTAPAAVGTHLIMATSTADNSASATCVVTVQSASQASITVQAAVGSGGSNGVVNLTATVSNSSSTAVSWTVDGITNGNASVGSITTGSGNTAVYAAPNSTGTHTILAVLQADSSVVSNAIVVQVQGISGPSVTVQASSATVAVSGTVSLTATVANSSSTAVTWTVDEITNGNSSVGTITAGSGGQATYTAPATTGAHTVQAVLQSNTSVVSNQVTITVQAPGQPTVTVQASSASVAEGGTVSLTATVANSANTAVTWSVDGTANGSSTVGTITAGSGNQATYTAPAATGSHIVRAALQANSSVVSNPVTIAVEAPAQVSVSLSPSGTTYVNTSGALLFTASVSGSGNTAVTWSVDGVSNGSASVGTITVSPSDGNTAIYNAPSGTGSHTVTATSSASGSQFASAPVIVAAATAQVANPGKTFNVKDYGATGNGSTDDTAAIQSAVDAANGTGGEVIVPPGTYLINPVRLQGIGINLHSNMTFTVQGGATLQAASTNTSAYYMVMAEKVSNVNIRGGGTVVGNRYNNDISDSNEGGFGIAVVGSSHVVVEGLTAKDCWGDGFYVTQGCADVTLAGVTADSNRRNGMAITSVTGMVVRDSTFSNTTGMEESGSWVNGFGIDVEPNSGETVDQLLVAGCTFKDNYWSDIASGVAVGLSAEVQDVYIYQNGFTRSSGSSTGYAGVEISNCSGTVVLDNTLDYLREYGILLRNGAADSYVVGNQVTRTQAPYGDGIEEYIGTDNVITGNTCENNVGYGIRSSNSSGTTISGNTLSGNGNPP